MKLTWGVWVEGSSVLVVADGLSAFRMEAWCREVGYRDAVAVWSRDGVRWRVVTAEDVVRPDPVPPTRRPPQAPQNWVARLPGWEWAIGAWCRVMRADRRPVGGGWWRWVRRE